MLGTQFGRNCLAGYSVKAIATGNIVALKFVLLATVLEAYRGLSTEFPLVIVGDGETGSEYSESLLRQAGGEERDARAVGVDPVG